jgi:hypothetical protein
MFFMCTGRRLRLLNERINHALPTIDSKGFRCQLWCLIVIVNEDILDWAKVRRYLPIDAITGKVQDDQHSRNRNPIILC